MAPSTERGQATHLTTTPDGKLFAYPSQTDVIVREEEVREALSLSKEPANWIQNFQQAHQYGQCGEVREERREDREWNG